jgi:hypothetical protein
VDPEFTDAEAWATSNGAVVRPFQVGLANGVASLAPSVVCNGGIVSQMFDMPPYDSAEPFVAEVTYKAEFVNGVGVGFGRAFKTLPVSPEWTTARFCLGEAAYGPADSGYGGPVSFQVGASEKSTFCNSEPFEGLIEFDRLDIMPANTGECPALGTVLNGEATMSGGGWRFAIDDVPEGGETNGAVEAGVGRDGTSGARIYKQPGQNRSSMATELSVELPSTMPYRAMRFSWKASEGSVHVVELGTHFGTRATNRVIDTLVGEGDWREATYCLPPWTHGNSVELAFVPYLESFDNATELVVDDVELTTEERCGSATDLLDPEFDSTPMLWPGRYDFGSETDGGSIRVLEDEENAQTGRGVLQMRYTANDQTLRFEHWMLVPQPVDDEGPVLRFSYKVPPMAPLPVYYFLGRAGERTSTLLGSQVWQRIDDVCLPPEWAGRWYRFQIRIDPSDESFAPIDPAIEVYLDDFELDTDVLCRAD